MNWDLLSQFLVVIGIIVATRLLFLLHREVLPKLFRDVKNRHHEIRRSEGEDRKKKIIWQVLTVLGIVAIIVVWLLV